MDNLFEAYEQYQDESNVGATLGHNPEVIVIPLQDNMQVPHDIQKNNEQAQTVSTASNNMQVQQRDNMEVQIHEHIPAETVVCAVDMESNPTQHDSLGNVITVPIVNHSPNTMQLQNWMNCMSTTQKQAAVMENVVDTTVFQPHSPEGIQHLLSQETNQAHPTIHMTDSSADNSHKSKLESVCSEITIQQTPPVLDTPLTKRDGTTAVQAKQPVSSERRSPRLKSNEKQKPVMKLAQELLAKKWGVLQPS